MGFFDFLKRKKVVGKQAVPATETAATATPADPAAASSAKPAKPASSAPASKADAPASSDQCAAITAAGTQCKSSSRENSKYCGRHKGYRAPAKSANGAKAADGAKSTNGAKGTNGAKAGGNGRQITHGDYKLFQNGNRYFFSKKTQAEAKKSGATPVQKMPEGRTVVVTPNGLPVLKKQ